MSGERPLPSPDPLTAPFWEGARAHKLRLPRCKDCGEVHFYPRCACPQCASVQLEWIDASGEGTIYSFTVVHRAPSPAFKDKLPYVVAVIALAEGPHLMTNIGGCAPENVRVGMPVEVAWEDVDPVVTLPYFVPAGPTRALSNTRG
jgi:uncharacterized OB-fold protein